MVLGLLVKHIMTRKVIRIDQGKSVQDAAKEMTKHRVGSIIVTKNDKPIGIITESDLKKKIVALNKDSKKVKTKDIMNSPLVFIPSSVDITVAVDKMKKHKIKRIPVIDKEKLVGIMTYTDIARSSPDLMELLDWRMKLEGGPSIKETSTSGICESCGNYSDDLSYENEQWICESCRDII